MADIGSCRRLENIAICIMNQNPKQAVRDSVSAFIAARIPCPTESPRIGAIVKILKVLPEDPSGTEESGHRPNEVHDPHM
jgi:hypothetical protein